jgi:uncharacterized protein
MEFLTPEVVAALVVVSGIAGFVDAIAGGGGLLTIPALMAAGLSPAQALGTNKLQAAFGSLSASLNFARNGYVAFNEIGLAVLLTFLGAGLGAILVQSINPEFLRSVIPYLLIAAAAYFIFSPSIGDIDGHQRISHPAFALLIGTSIGFYDGVFGPGTGSFFVIAHVSLLGYTTTKATAHTKVLNFTSNIASLFLFILGGKVVWAVGLAMAGGQFIGGRLGAELVIGRGAKVVKPIIVSVCLAMTAKILFDASGKSVQGILAWAMKAVN